MKKLLIALAALAVVALGAYLAKDLARTVHLSIPSCGIEVECEQVFTLRSSKLQQVVDKPGIAAYYGKYILDHAGQNFRDLWKIRPGDQVIFGTVRYRCSYITVGWSDRGIYTDAGEPPEADLYLCTCVPGGEEYDIYIVGIEKI
nr:MAG TPA: sortase, transpeptidase, BETA BARREL, HYDROLASE.8A [Caudoviricetes sp.]